MLFGRAGVSPGTDFALGGKLWQYHIWKDRITPWLGLAKPGGLLHIRTSAPLHCGRGVDYCQQAAMPWVEIRRVLQGALGRLAGSPFSVFANTVMWNSAALWLLAGAAESLLGHTCFQTFPVPKYLPVATYQGMRHSFSWALRGVALSCTRREVYGAQCDPRSAQGITKPQENDTVVLGKLAGWGCGAVTSQGSPR